MQISELKTKLEEKTFKIEELNIKSYLPLLHKRVVVNQILDDIISYDENGLAFVDNTQKTITVSLSVLLNYCDIELSENPDTNDIIDVLDLLFENNTYEEIQNKIGNDVYDLLWLVDEEVENLKMKKNSLESIVAKGINALLLKIPSDKELAKLIKTASKEFQKFDPQKMKHVQEMIKVVK